MRFKGLLLAVFLLLGTLNVSGASVGALPSSIDAGDVGPGEEVTVDIYVRASNVDEAFSINPSSNSVNPTSLFSNYEAGRLSEVGSAEWWEIESTNVNPDTTVEEFDLDVSEENIPELHGVTQATLTVPSNAEPGVRRGSIQLNPNITSDGEGFGNSIVASTEIKYRFNVPGEVERDIVVQDIRGFRTETDTASVELLLSNEGTVTVSSQTFSIDVLDQQGDAVDTLTAPGVTLEPGESEWTNAYWSGGSVNEGTYQVDGQVDYLTGSAYASGSFSLGDVVEVRPSNSPTVDSDDQQGDGVPIWFVVIVLVILGVLMWGFEIEPFWIVTILGILGISAFILMSGLPNLLLAVLLIMVGIIIYGGM